MTTYHCDVCRAGSPARADRPDITTPAQLRDLMGLDFDYSEEQFAAITAPLEPGVIVAGAGSGKTAVMAARVVWLVATGRVEPGEVLGLTFTTKATAELRERVVTSLQKAGCLPDPSVAPGPGDVEVTEPTISTYNAFAASLLSEHGLLIGHEPDTRVMADAARYQVAARAVASYDRPSEHLPTSVSEATTRLLALDAELSEHLVSPERLRSFDAGHRAALLDEQSTSRARVHFDELVAVTDQRENLLDLVELYRAHKRDLGVMDFSDQVALTARLVDEHPELSAALRERYRVVLLDEYQDTSVAQAHLLQRLFSGPEAAVGRGHPVTAVGDPNQAIYGWRGASVSNILRFGAQFPRACGESAARYSLAVNRRSERHILDVATTTADPLYQSLEQTLGAVERLAAPDDAADGTVEVALHATYDHELEALARDVHDRVHELHRSGEHVDGAPPWSAIAVLAKTNDHLADVFSTLTREGIPVEIVGLGGLIRLPEVLQVVDTLRVIDDVTANAALLTLLTGPRWQIGPRDLALLGRRAAQLVGRHGHGRDDDLPFADQLQEATTGTDEADVPALCDALDDLGDLAYSTQARERFGLLAAELAHLRGMTGEPLLDLVRRVVDRSGIETELAAAVDPVVRARRDNIDAFVAVVADFVSVDGNSGLGGLLAWLDAEAEHGSGLEVATPSAANSVKLLTLHRAKGLEWDTVFVVGVCLNKFPKRDARSQWVSNAKVLPFPLRGDAADLPTIGEFSRASVKDFQERWKKQHLLEERRLAYVAFTRAEHRLVLSGYWWSRTASRPFGPSDYLTGALAQIESWGGSAQVWEPEPQPAEGDDKPVNPLLEHTSSAAWPVEGLTPEDDARRRGMQAWRAAAARQAAGEPAATPEVSDPDAAALLARLDDEAALLLAEARDQQLDVVDVELPPSLSATALARLRDDPDTFAAELARPMPRRPSPSARFGTRFHAWVESRFGQQTLLDPLDLPGRAESDIDDDGDLTRLIASFEAGVFADRVPTHVEPPFALTIGGQVVRGRIDAVFDDGDGRVLIVDWKTNRQHAADPLQLAIYRLAWSELTGVPLEHIRAAFYYVRSNELVEPEELASRNDIVRYLTGGQEATDSG